jgi:hypothetical protein
MFLYQSHPQSTFPLAHWLVGFLAKQGKILIRPLQAIAYFITYSYSL